MNPHQSQGASKILVIIFWNFTIFQYSSHSPQSKPNSISSIAKLVYELPPELPNDLRLRILGNQKYQKNLKFGWRQSLVPSLSSRNSTLSIANKNHAKMDIKLFFSCPILLDFCILFQIFCKFLVLTQPNLLKLQVFDIFYNFKALLQSSIKI